MSAPVKRQKSLLDRRTLAIHRRTPPSDSGVEQDLEHYRFDLVALTLLFRGLSDALRLARMKEIHRWRHTRADQAAHRSGHSRPLHDEDLVAYA